jgi:hypothetical protein
MIRIIATILSWTILGLARYTPAILRFLGIGLVLLAAAAAHGVAATTRGLAIAWPALATLTTASYWQAAQAGRRLARRYL